MPRLAWFTPLPPARTGISAYNAELLPLLRHDADIDVFLDPRLHPIVDLGVPMFPSHDFVWRNVRHPYDLTVYQLGNSPAHDYMWPYLVRFPGLLMLHDAQLHHSRARSLLAQGRADHYRAEFRFCHPDASQSAAERVIPSMGCSTFYLWPLISIAMEASRLVAVHGRGLAALLADAYPRQEPCVIDMGVADPIMSSEAGAKARARHGIPQNAIVFAAYGLLTPEKRLPFVLRALRGILPYAPDACLLLIGAHVDHYDVLEDAREVGVADHVTLAGYVPDEEMSEYLNAADVCLSLRWPTSRETSSAWLRCLAAGKPTIVTDLVHTCGVPSLDPRTWTSLEPRIVGTETAEEHQPVCVAIDLLDEEHSLGLAMRRLARDERLRKVLGQRARQYWSVHHTLPHMADDYRQAIGAALARPVPDRSHLPPHLLADGMEQTHRLLREFGVTVEDIGFD